MIRILTVYFTGNSILAACSKLFQIALMKTTVFESSTTMFSSYYYNIIYDCSIQSVSRKILPPVSLFLFLVTVSMMTIEILENCPDNNWLLKKNNWIHGIFWQIPKHIFNRTSYIFWQCFLRFKFWPIWYLT